jgi:Tol biopolymer transport system component
MLPRAVLFASLIPSAAHAQGGTDIYVGALRHNDGRASVGQLTNATDRDGYDSQPHFGPDGTYILYTSARSDGQTDIYRYEIGSNRSTAVTRTRESEYSPSAIPGSSAFSVIRVEADSTQRLWSFDADGQNAELILENIQPVGYHAWSGDGVTVALFVLGSPPTLQLASTRTGMARIIERNIGRSLHRIPGEAAISFVHKASDEEWWIRRLDLGSGRVTSLTKTIPGSEDYAWTPRGTILMGSGSLLYQWTIGSPDSWTQVADFADQGVQAITRIAVSAAGDRIAIVGDRR